MTLRDRAIRKHAGARRMLLVIAIALLWPMAVAQPPSLSRETSPPSTPVAEADRPAEIERLKFEIRQAMSAREWTAAINAADALLLLNPDDPTAVVQRESAQRMIATGEPEGMVPPPSPPTRVVTEPADSQTPEPEAAINVVPPATPLSTGGDSPMPTELILISIGAAVVLLIMVWFFFFARKKPAERRSPAPDATPVVSRPISPYSKSKPVEPPKDENLFQYGAVGQLNQPGGGEAAAAAAGAAAAVAAASAPAVEDPPTVREFPREPEPPKQSAPPEKLSIEEADTQREESTPSDHEASHPAIEVSEPVPALAKVDADAPPELTVPLERELQILHVDLESVEIEPAAPPAAGEAGPDVESLPTIKLSEASVAAPVAAEAEEQPVGADLPVISFDASMPLELSPKSESHAAEDAISHASLPTIQMSEEIVHLAGGDDGGLNDLPELTAGLGEGLPTLKLSDTPLEELEKLVNGGSENVPSGSGGDGLRSIKLVEG
jgi:hypothetical protein